VPLLLLGSPGYYGDDNNLIQELQESGLIGSIEIWVKEYGWSYRPLGISITYLFYYLLYEHPFFIYFIYQLIYLAIGWYLYKNMYEITSQKWLSVFVGIFFILFPFNATAYWQLSSFAMVLVTLFSIILMSKYIIKIKFHNYYILSILSFFWLALLFSYEQIIGLILVILLVFWLREPKIGFYRRTKNTIIKSFSLILITLIFLFSYLSTNENAKLSSLSKINNSYEMNIDISENIIEEKTNDSVRILLNGSRIKHTLVRLTKVADYFASNFTYSLSSLIEYKLKGVLLITLLGVFAILTFFIDARLIEKMFAIKILLIGAVWFLASLAPFFLYPEADIPVYALMLPSVGLGIGAFGLISLICYLFNFSFIVVRITLFFIAFSLPLMQYGYYFGLKEELNYWEDIAENIDIYQDNLSDGSTLVLHNIDLKKNSHIFWLEKAIAQRHLRFNLNYGFPSIIIHKDINKITLRRRSNNEDEKYPRVIHINEILD
jgi:hypothetical protein